MRAILLLFFWGFALAAQAQNVTQLERQMVQTEAQLSRLQKQLKEKQQVLGQTQQQAEGAAKLMLQANAYPAAVWQSKLVLNNQPGSSALLAFATKQQAQHLSSLQARYRSLFALYAEAQAQQQQWQDLRRQLMQTETRPNRRQRRALAAAGLDATQLAARLATAMNEPVPTPTLVMPTLDVVVAPPPTKKPTPLKPRITDNGQRVAPLVGKVAVGFRQGEGAEAEGVVLAAAAGTPVVAPFNARVVFAGIFRQFGGLVILEGADGHDEVLGGLGVLMVRQGQSVKAGQQLGHLGTRGRLYWEVRVRGTARNPLTFKKL